MTTGEQMDVTKALMPAIWKARKAILEVYTSGEFGTEEKPDRTPVTMADRLSHEILSYELRKLTPDIPVISEEAGEEVSDVQNNQYFWLLDPLDGTKEFIRQSGEFTINIGLVAPTGEAVLGIIDVPCERNTYIGLDHQVLMDDGTTRRSLMATPRSSNKGAVVALSRSHEGLAGDWLSDHHVDVDHIIYGGSALKFCWIATGTVDLYVRLRPTMGWDTAAGQALVEAAYGSLTTLQGDPLRYQPGAYVNPYFVAQGPRAIQG